MADNQPLINICTYRVKPGKNAEMEALLAKHWPTLRAAGLVTDEPARVYRGISTGKPQEDPAADRTYVEILIWKDGQAPHRAHEIPEVMAVWGAHGRDL